MAKSTSFGSTSSIHMLLRRKGTMGLSDIFNIGNIKKENEELKEMLTPDMNDAIDLQHKINDFNK